MAPANGISGQRRKSAGMRRLLAGMSVAAAFGAAISFVWLTDAGKAPDAATTIAAPSAGEARAIGARWRASRNAALGAEYARALIAAGLYDELLTEISERGLFKGDAVGAALYRTEAALRQGRYEEALQSGGEGSAFENPYLAYARARAAYALTGDPSAVAEDLARALRGPAELTADAWLFRARLALDANDFETAEAAARRAAEAGADQRSVEAVSIEKSVRAGDLQSAATRLAARMKSAKGAAAGKLENDFRLAAMVNLKAGDAESAVRLVEEGRLAGAMDASARLLAALAKWMGGDEAQAYTLASGVLAASPENWTAIDLAAAIARDLGRNDEADALLERLAARRPALALARRYGDGVPSTDHDEAFAQFSGLDDDLASGGVAAALLGADRNMPALIKEPGASVRMAARLAKSINENDARGMRKAALAAVDGGGGVLTIALAGEAFRRIGDFDRADDAFARASAAEPGFFAPLGARVRLFVDRGNRPAAIGLLREFLVVNPVNLEALVAMAILEEESGAARAAAASFSSLAPKEVFADEAAAIHYARAALKTGPAALELMLERARENATSMRLLGRIYSAVGDDERAAAAFRLALIADPADLEVPGEYFAAMERLGRGDEARTLLAEIVRRRPDARGAGDALAAAGDEIGKSVEIVRF
jgi:tetratricopeptide (TPR) repeat protein